MQNMVVIKEDLLQWFTSFSIKRLVEVVLLLNQIINLQINFIGRLLENLRGKVYSLFRDNILGVGLTDMQSLSKYNKQI